MNEEYGNDIVSVVDEDGVEHVFEELDRIETDKGRYVALPFLMMRRKLLRTTESLLF